MRHIRSQRSNDQQGKIEVGSIALLSNLDKPEQHIRFIPQKDITPPPPGLGQILTRRWPKLWGVVLGKVRARNLVAGFGASARERCGLTS